jgi:hypothetical protein
MSLPTARSKVRAFLLEIDLSAFVCSDVAELYASIFRVFSIKHRGVTFSEFHAAADVLGFVPAPASYTLKRSRV